MKLILIFLFSAIAAPAQTPEWSRKYHTGAVNCLQFSKDGTKLITGGADGKVMLWDVSNSDTIKTFKRFSTEVLSLDFDSKDIRLLASTKDLNTHILDRNLDTVVKTIILSSNLFYNVNFVISLSSITNNIAYWTNEDKKIKINNGGSAQQFFEGAYGGGESGKTARFDIDSNKLIENEGGFVDVFKISLDRKSEASIFHSYYSPYGSHRKNGSLRNSSSFSCNAGKFRQSFYGNSVYQSDTLGSNRITNFGFTGDSKYVLSYNQGGKVHIRDVSDSAVIDSLGSPIGGVIELSGDMGGKYYITMHSDSTLRIWTRGIHNIFKKLKLPSNVTKSAVATIAFSPDYFHFATVHNDGIVAYWDMNYITKYATTDSVFTPAITSISENKTLCKEENAEFQVAAQSNFGEELLYQWQKGGVDLTESDSINGVHSTKLVLKNIEASDAGTYSIKVTSAAKPQSISASVSLAVKNIPVFKKPVTALYQQLDWSYKSIILFHAELMDSVGAEYQWFKNGVEIPGAAKSQYYFERKDSALHAGEFTVRVTNQCGSTLSNPIIIEEAVNSISENPFKSTTTLTSEPNPFKNSTTIRFSLPSSLKIKLAVTDILGREVAVLKDEVVEIGEQNIVFKNEDLPDGTYFITLSGDGLLQTIPVQIAR